MTRNQSRPSLVGFSGKKRRDAPNIASEGQQGLVGTPEKAVLSERAEEFLD
jgi:hypothetical protein